MPEASHGVGAQATVKANEDEVRVRSSFEEMKYLIFSFLCFGVEAKRGVEFRHSIR